MTTAEINPNHVYQLACHVEPLDQSWSLGRVSIEFAAIQGLQKERICLRRRFLCEQHVSTSHCQGDATQPVSLFGLPDTDAHDRQASMIDRNIADLLTMYVSDVAGSEDAIVLIGGRPLTKAVSRLAYRCVNKKVLIAFFSWNDAIAEGPRLPDYGSGRWSGPFPDLHEDCTVRTFYSRNSAAGESARVDIFLQSFGSISLSADIPKDITERLQRLEQLSVAFGDSTAGHVPPDLLMLANSLQWSTVKFRTALKEHQAALEKKLGSDRVRQVIDKGIMAVEPVARLAARLGAKDQPYIQERLFATLQAKVANLGLSEGLADFLRVDEESS